MDEQPTDDDLRALRALDPAAAARAPESLRQRVAVLGTRDEPGASGGGGSSRGARRGRWLAPVAAASLVVATAASVFALGSGGVAGPDAVMALTMTAPGRIAPPVHLGASASGSAPEHGKATSAATTDAYAMSLPWPYGGRQRFTAPRLDGTSGEADVYVVDGASRYSAEEAARIAAALGVPGDPVATGDGGWTVGSYDAGGTVGLSPWNGTTVNYSGGLPDPFDDCMIRLSGSGLMDGTTAQAQCAVEVPPPTEEQARAALSAFLAAVGIDEDDVSIGVAASEKESSVLTAVASRAVDGMATPVTISVAVSAGGIVWGSGTIGDLVPLGEYTIVSPAEAAERLNTSAFSPERSYEPGILVAQPAIGVPPTQPPARPEAGSKVPWPIAEHRIVSVRLGLSTVSSDDGVLYVVPAYEFTDSEKGRWSVTALDEDDLDVAAPPGYGLW